MAAILLDIEGEAVFLQDTRKHLRNCQGKSLEMVVQVAEEDNVKIVETIKVGGTILKSRWKGGYCSVINLVF